LTLSPFALPELGTPGPVVSYLAFAALAIVGPGVALPRLLRLKVDPALVLPLGTAVAAGLYWLGLAMGQPWIFPLSLGVLDLMILLPRGPWRLAEGPSARGAVAPFLVLVALLALTQYPWNRIGPTGEFLMDPLVTYDTGFHVGLARELTLGYPPQLPGVSGFPIRYHLGIDLLRAAALRWAGVDPYDCITRLDVTVGALALVLALRGVVSCLRGSPAAVALVPWTLLLTDFSFVFAANPSAHWWTDLLRANLLISLFLANPVVPALALALGALIALSRHQAGEGRGWLALAVVQALAVPFFKVFLGAHLLLGLGAAAVLHRRHRLGPLLATALACGLGTAALVLGQGAQTVAVAFAPLDLVRVTRETLELAPLPGPSLFVFSLFWVACSLGLRLLGLPAALRALRSDHAPAVALAAMALAAWPLGLLFRVSAPEVLEGQRVVNDAAYLIEQGGPLLWIFTSLTLVGLGASLARAALVALAVAALALPATLQFLVKKAGLPPDRLPAATVRAMDVLSRSSQPGEVILQRPGARYPPAPVILIGRRVAYERFTPYLTQFAPREALEARHETVFRFFRTPDGAEAREIARGLGARFLCLYGGDRIRFEAPGMLEPLYEEPGVRLYRINPEAR
jgi:hypothetical protein